MQTANGMFKSKKSERESVCVWSEIVFSSGKKSAFSSFSLPEDLLGPLHICSFNKRIEIYIYCYH